MCQTFNKSLYTSCKFLSSFGKFSSQVVCIVTSRKSSKVQDIANLNQGLNPRGKLDSTQDAGFDLRTTKYYKPIQARLINSCFGYSFEKVFWSCNLPMVCERTPYSYLFSLFVLCFVYEILIHNSPKI